MTPNSAQRLLNKWFVLYSLLVILAFCLLSLLQKMDEDAVATHYYVAVAASGILGILHCLFFYRLTDLITPGDFWKGLLYILLLMLLSALGIFLLYHFIGGDISFISFIGPFLLPYCCWQAYRAFTGIPDRDFKLWYYPVQQEMPDLDMIDLSRIEVVQFVFSKDAGDSALTSFTSKAPLNMSLGLLFFIFINDYNEKNRQQPIGFLDALQSPYGWLFYRRKKSFGGKFYFDPDLSISDNRILPNETIYALRKG